MKRPITKSAWLLTPLIGCCLFILLYIIAALLYPGGSMIDETAKGFFCLLLIGANNYIYYTGNWLYVLPVLQKITFLLVMTWMGIITWAIYRKVEKVVTN